ncbi:unnamed protein product [Trichogramma brassicae]|uniref:Integrase catalytic domain-containing protein n=1 Tax=Trichogramma brassicae TaxID=86971 RepID=A0A6H5HY81_9HYME|nr:unnamed protein product [Trichogramma brassicae]
MSAKIQSTDRTERPFDEEGFFVDRPWAVVAADMMEFHGVKTGQNHKYLRFFKNWFTRCLMKLYAPTHNANGVNVLRAFEELCCFGGKRPEFLLTDNGGKEFDNAVWSAPRKRGANGVRFDRRCQGINRKDCHTSVRPAWMDDGERGRSSSPRETPAEEARAAKEECFLG